MPVHKWSKTANDNATADSTINWAEGQAPSSVNDSARAEMAAVAKWRDDISGTLTTTGSSTAYALSTNSAFASAAVMSGAQICFIPHVTSGAAPTLAVDGLTARAINISTGVAVPTGALVAGTPYTATYIHATTEFILRGGLATLDTVPAISTDAGAVAGPTLDLYRNSASPAASDFIGTVDFNGRDSAGNKQLFARLVAQITDPTSTTEDAIVLLQAVIAGTLTTLLQTSATGISITGALATSGGGSFGGNVTVSGTITPSTPPVTQQTLLSGTTYNTPANVRCIKVRMIGGGAGGGSVAGGTSTAGGATSFNSITAAGGNPGSSDAGGSGATTGTGTASLRVRGAAGQNTFRNRSAGGAGGAGPFGGSGIGRGVDGNTAASAGATNSGAGGGGGNDGGGGQSGEYVELLIQSPAASYTYAIGTAGNGATGGGAGGTGVIVVDEYY